jgi:hypothetical protein
VKTSSGPRWREYFPTPLVGIAALLVALILLTPNLINNGTPPAGSILTQAELIVDRAPGATNVTNFYVRGLSLVHYASVNLSFANNYNFTHNSPAVSGLKWGNFSNSSYVLTVTAASTANPIVINVTATYTESGVVVYGGVLAFYIVAGTLYSRQLVGYGASAPPASTKVTALPLYIILGTEYVV